MKERHRGISIQQAGVCVAVRRNTAAEESHRGDLSHVSVNRNASKRCFVAQRGGGLFFLPARPSRAQAYSLTLGLRRNLLQLTLRQRCVFQSHAYAVVLPNQFARIEQGK